MGIPYFLKTPVTPQESFAMTPLLFAPFGCLLVSWYLITLRFRSKKKDSVHTCLGQGSKINQWSWLSRHKHSSCMRSSVSLVSRGLLFRNWKYCHILLHPTLLHTPPFPVYFTLCVCGGSIAVVNTHIHAGKWLWSKVTLKSFWPAVIFVAYTLFPY